MSQELLVDVESLRAEVRDKYRAVAVAPTARYHFHTGRSLAARLGYDPDVVSALIPRNPTAPHTRHPAQTQVHPHCAQALLLLLV